MISSGIRHVCLLLMLVSFAPSPMKAEQQASKQETREPLNMKQVAVNVVYPILFYSPETRMGFGFQFNHIFRGRQKELSTRPSRVMPMLIYTQNNQVIAELRTDLYLANESFHIKSLFNYQDYPDTFFGIGNDTLEENREDYTNRFLEVQLRLERKVLPGLWLGGQYHFQDWTISEYEEDGMLAAGEIPGSDQGRISGLGFLVSRDTRNHLFYPTRGDYFSVSFKLFHSAIGSTFDFSMLKMDLRKYFRTTGDQVLAVQAVMETRSGTPPFHMLSQLGGSSLMRGYYLGRYRDNHLVAFQAEYRLPLFWRLGVVLFGGLGEVTDSWNRFSVDGFKFSLGFGIRYLFNSREHINARMDIGIGSGNTRVYMDAPEAF